MTKDELEERKEALKVTLSVPDILSRYGVEVNRGRCKAICHETRMRGAKNAKVSEGLYYCFVCDKSMDIFDIEMHFSHCDFWTAFELLGGTEKPSFTATRKAKTAIRERDNKVKRQREDELILRRIRMHIAAYRNIIKESEPLSDLWCFAQNKLPYQIYLLEYYDEKR